MREEAATTEEESHNRRSLQQQWVYGFMLELKKKPAAVEKESQYFIYLFIFYRDLGKIGISK